MVAEDEVEISIPGHAFRCWVDYAPRHEHPLDIKKPSENLGGNYPSLGVFDAVEHIWMVPDSVVDRRREHKHVRPEAGLLSDQDRCTRNVLNRCRACLVPLQELPCARGDRHALQVGIPNGCSEVVLGPYLLPL